MPIKSNRLFYRQAEPQNNVVGSVGSDFVFIMKLMKLRLC